jgi:hypothetical protein
LGPPGQRSSPLRCRRPSLDKQRRQDRGLTTRGPYPVTHSRRSWAPGSGDIGTASSNVWGDGAGPALGNDPCGICHR